MVMNQRNANLPEGSDPQLSGFYHAAPADSPPAQLDADILAAARRAVGARPQTARASLLRTWRVPLSIAAVLVMSVSMVTLTVRQKGVQVMEPEYTGPASVLRSEPVPPATISERPVPGNAGVERKAVRATKPGTEITPAPVDAQAGGAGPVADMAGKAGAPPQLARNQQDAASRAAVQEKQAFSPPAESAVLAKERLAAPPAQQPARVLPAPASAAPGLATGAQGRSAQGDRAAAGITATGKDTALQASIFIRELDKQPAAKWLQKIATLRQQGNMAAADALLAEFRKHYPNHPLPVTVQ
jgi:hypothetical protein